MAFVTLAGVLLVAWNAIASHPRFPVALYVPANLVVAAAALAAARAFGLSWGALGLDGERLAVSLGRGAIVAVPAGAALLLAALLVPGATRTFADPRLAQLSGSGLAFELLIRIPIGTALVEEVLFRGVLLGAWNRAGSLAVAVIGSSVVYALWHLGPTLFRAQAAGLDPLGALAVSLPATFLGGLLFCGLRIWAGNVAAPALVHTAINAATAAAAWIVLRASAG